MPSVNQILNGQKRKKKKEPQILEIESTPNAPAILSTILHSFLGREKNIVRGPARMTQGTAQGLR